MQRAVLAAPNTNYYSACAATLWRNAAYYTSMRPYPSIPHLRGHYFSGGRLSYLQNNGFVKNMREAAALGGMCTFWVESKLTILITDPELVYQYKTFGQTNFTDSHIPNLDQVLGPSATNHKHLNTRRIYHHALSGRSLARIEESVSNVGDAKIAALNNDDNPGIKNAGRYFRELMFDLALNLFMGVKTADLAKDDYDNIIAYIDKLFTGNDKDYLLYILNLKEIPKDDTDLERRLNEFKKNMAREFKELILDKYNIDSDSVFYKIWTETKEYNDDDEYTPENVFPEAFFFLVGGPVSSLGDSFTIVLQLICQHEDVHNKLSELLATNNEEALIYLDQIIKEAFRLHPPVAVLPAHTVKEDFILNGITIKTGDNIVISPLVNHCDPAYWPQPERFNPDRFAANANIPRGTYFPFGLGDRGCPGSQYGLLVLKTLIAKLFRNFDVKIKKDSTLQHLGPTTVTANLDVQLNKRNHNLTKSFKR